MIDMVTKIMSSKNISQIEALKVCALSATAGTEVHIKARSYLAKNKWTEEEEEFIYYDAVYREEGKLGLSFKWTENRDFVVDLIDSSGKSAKDGVVRLQDTLVAVNFESVESMNLMELDQTLFNALHDPPRVLRFKRRKLKTAIVKTKLQNHPQKRSRKVIGISVEKVTTASMPIKITRFEGSLGLQVDRAMTVAAVDDSSKVASDLSEFAEATGSIVAAGDVIAAVNMKSTNIMHLEQSTTRTIVWDRMEIETSDSEETSKETQIDTGIEKDSFGKDGLLIIMEPPIMRGDTFPVTFALYSENPSCKVQPLVLSSPEKLQMACKPIKGVEYPPNAVVMVQRGMCSFVTKGKHVNFLGPRDILVVTRNFEPMTAMPASAAEIAHSKINFAMAMIDHVSGATLASLLKAGTLQVLFYSPTCGKPYNATEDEQIQPPLSNQVIPLNTVELMIWDSNSGLTHRVYSVYGDFGPVFTNIPSSMQSSRASPLALAPYPHYGCDPPPLNYQGALVMVFRGVCPYSEKALQVLQAGGAGIVLVDTERKDIHVQPMRMHPDQAAALVTIPGLSVNASIGEMIKNLVQERPIIAKFFRKHFYHCNEKKTICF